MRLIPSSSDPDPDRPLTRRLQNWKWRRRDPPSPATLPEPTVTETLPYCLGTVILGHVLLDFEAYAVMVGPDRYLLPVRQFQLLAALLFAEGGEVSVAALAALIRPAAAQHRALLVRRELKHLKATALHARLAMKVTGTGHGYHLRHATAPPCGQCRPGGKAGHPRLGSVHGPRAPGRLPPA